jgi:hypothetical protein
LPIVFLYFCANQADASNALSLPALETGFVNHVNAPAYGKMTEEYFRTLQVIHERCLQ